MLYNCSRLSGSQAVDSYHFLPWILDSGLGKHHVDVQQMLGSLVRQLTADGHDRTLRGWHTL